MPDNKNDKCDFSDILIMFLLYAHAKKVAAFPSIRTSAWHEFIYSFKTAYFDKFPELGCFGEFSWKGHCPISKKLAEQAAVSPCIWFLDCRTQTMFLPDDTRIFYESYLRKKLLKHEKILRAMYDFAKNIPGFFKF